MPKRSLLDYVAEHAARSPGRAALRCGGRTTTYGELAEAAARCRGALAALGVGPGDRVALVMSDSPQMVVATLGIMGLGAIAVPCSTQLPGEGLAYAFRDSGAKIVIATGEHAAAARAAGAPRVVGAPEEFEALLAQAAPAPLAAFDASTPCLVLYTSGSTGQPKGAVHRHGHLPHSVEAVGGGVFGLGPQDRLFSVPRLFFAFGLGNSFTLPLGAGACSILLPARPAPALVAEVLAAERPTVFFAVPTVFRQLLEHARQGHRLDTGSIRLSVSAGEVLPLATWEEWKALTGHEIVESLGTTELLYAFLHNRPSRNRPGSSGEAVDGYEVRLLDDAGAAVEGAGRGVLHARGPTVFSHYLNKPEKTAESLREGWVRTGDVYRRDADGYYWFEGRADDLFKCSGMWVAPAEVEAALCRHPAVLEAAVVAGADAHGGTIPVAFAQLREGTAGNEALAAEILAQAAASLPRFKRPQRVEFLAQLPRTPTGKVQRYKLRAAARGG